MSPQNGSHVWSCRDVHLSTSSKGETRKLVSSETKETENSTRYFFLSAASDIFALQRNLYHTLRICPTTFKSAEKVGLDAV